MFPISINIVGRIIMVSLRIRTVFDVECGSSSQTISGKPCLKQSQQSPLARNDFVWTLFTGQGRTESKKEMLKKQSSFQDFAGFDRMRLCVITPNSLSMKGRSFSDRIAFVADVISS
mmetsp:Transcript_47302/g.54494  ORF Transcript_47302/g.54494 Transcript_47302/m.54494 type:complete len:117 (-) Transcript_47302:225-575(-)